MVCELYFNKAIAKKTMKALKVIINLGKTFLSLLLSLEMFHYVVVITTANRVSYVAVRLGYCEAQ